MVSEDAQGDDQKAFCSSPSGLLNPRSLASAAPIRGISHLWCGPFGTFSHPLHMQAHSCRRILLERELCVRRETRRLCHLPSMPRSLPSTSLGHLPVSKRCASRSVLPKPCCTTLQWWIDLLLCPENLRTCD